MVRRWEVTSAEYIDTKTSQVGILLHLDPPLAHTVHIEPLTPADWESGYPEPRQPGSY